VSNRLLQEAVRQGNIDKVVNCLHAAKADANHRDCNGSTPIHVAWTPGAICFGPPSLFFFFSLLFGCFVFGNVFGSRQVQNRWCALFLFVGREGKKKKKPHANINFFLMYCRPPALQSAAEMGRIDVMQILIQHHAEVNVHEVDAVGGRTPLHKAVVNGHLEVRAKKKKLPFISFHFTFFLSFLPFILFSFAVLSFFLSFLHLVYLVSLILSKDEPHIFSIEYRAFS
jgi:hypothetical protein